MTTIGTLAAKLSLDSAGFNAGLQRGANDLQRFATQVNNFRITLPKPEIPKPKEFGGVEEIVGKLKGGFASAAAFLGVELINEATKSIVEIDQKLRQTAGNKLLLQGTLGSAAASGITNFGKRSGAQGLAGLAGSLASKGLPKESIAGTLEQLNTVAAATDVPLQSLVGTFGEMLETGTATFQQLQEMAAQNIPIFEALAATMGKNRFEIMELAKQGKISAAEFQKALAGMTGKGALLSEVAKAKESEFEIAQRAVDQAGGSGWRFAKDIPLLGGLLRAGEGLGVLGGVGARHLFGKENLEGGMLAAAPPVPSTVLPMPQMDEAHGKRWIALQQEGAAVLKGIRTPAQQYAATVDNLKRLLDSGAISQGTFNRALAGMVDPAKVLAGPVGKGLVAPWENLKAKGQAIEQDLLTPLEKYQNQITELDTLLKRGAINQEFFDRAAFAAKNDLASSLFPQNPGVGAAERGSGEAFSAIRKFMEGDRREKGIDELVKDGKIADQRRRELIEIEKKKQQLVQVNF